MLIRIPDSPLRSSFNKPLPYSMNSQFTVVRLHNSYLLCSYDGNNYDIYDVIDACSLDDIVMLQYWQYMFDV